MNNIASRGSFPGDSRVFSSSSSNLAGSLLGGVMDHYSSVFVVHATTQTHHWEDALRQDLSAAAHHSTLDQQVAEAVAVVADTDTWYIYLFIYFILLLFFFILNCLSRLSKIYKILLYRNEGILEVAGNSVISVTSE